MLIRKTFTHRLSTIFTFTPARANPFAAITPAGPAPMMSTSTLLSFVIIEYYESSSERLHKEVQAMWSRWKLTYMSKVLPSQRFWMIFREFRS